MNLSGYNQYRESSAVTAQPEELIMMLYNGLVKFVMKAQYSLSKKDMQGVNESIQRAQAIVQEFISSLDRKNEISSSLYLLYDYMNRRLIDANIQKSEAILKEVLEFAKELRNTWEQAMKLAKHPPQKEAKAAGS